MPPMPFIVACLSILLCSACGGAGGTPSTTTLERPVTVHVLYLVDGDGWVAGRSVGQQDLGAHFRYVTASHEAGLLAANGIVLGGDDVAVRGIYFVASRTRDGVDRFVAEDPGVLNGVLRPESIESWQVEIDELDATLPTGASFYVVDYASGAPDEAQRRALGQLVAAGHTERGYLAIVAAQSRASIDAGEATVRQWRPATRGSIRQAFERQAAAR